MDKGQSDSSFKQTFRGSRDALLQNTLDEPELGWRLLITLNAFRLLISTGLLLLFVIGSEPRFFGDAKPTLFAATAAGYRPSHSARALATGRTGSIGVVGLMMAVNSSIGFSGGFAVSNRLIVFTCSMCLRVTV